MPEAKAVFGRWLFFWRVGGSLEGKTLEMRLRFRSVFLFWVERKLDCFRGPEPGFEWPEGHYIDATRRIQGEGLEELSLG